MSPRRAASPFAEAQNSFNDITATPPVARDVLRNVLDELDHAGAVEMNQGRLSSTDFAEAMQETYQAVADMNGERKVRPPLLKSEIEAMAGKAAMYRDIAASGDKPAVDKPTDTKRIKTSQRKA